MINDVPAQRLTLNVPTSKVPQNSRYYHLHLSRKKGKPSSEFCSPTYTLRMLFKLPTVRMQTSMQTHSNNHLQEGNWSPVIVAEQTRRQTTRPARKKNRKTTSKSIIRLGGVLSTRREKWWPFKTLTYGAGDGGDDDHRSPFHPIVAGLVVPIGKWIARPVMVVPWSWMAFCVCVRG